MTSLVEKIRMQHVEPGVGDTDEDARAVEPAGDGIRSKHIGGRVVEQRVKRRGDLDLHRRVSGGKRDEAVGRAAKARDARRQLHEPEITGGHARRQANARPDASRA